MPTAVAYPVAKEKLARTSTWQSDPYADKAVARIYDPTMSNFTHGVTSYDYYWRNFDLTKLQNMVETAIMQISAASNAADAWKQILPGVSATSKIAVKVNHNDVGFYPNDWYRSSNTSPAMMIALTRSLKKAGVQEANITFFDRSRDFPAAMKSDVRAQCPNVVMQGKSDNMAASSTKFTFSDYSCPYYIPQVLISANFLIDLFLCKSHDGGITGAIKNLGGLCEDPGNVLHNGHEWSGSNIMPDLIMMSPIRSKYMLGISEAVFLCQEPTEYLSSSKATKTDFFPGQMPNSIFVSRSPFMMDNVLEDFMSVEKNGSPTSHWKTITWLNKCVGKISTWTSNVVNAGSIVSRGGDMPPKDLSYDANYVDFISMRNPPPAYTLSTSAGTGGTMSNSPTGTSFSPGTVVTLTATPSSGYYFAGWTGDIAGPANPYSLAMDANKTVKANFRTTPLPKYTLSLTAGSAGGTVAASPTQAQYDSGTMVQATATPSSGYTFSGWAGDLAGSVNPATITMNSNKSVTGSFSVNTTPVTFEAENAGPSASAAGYNVSTGDAGNSNSAYVQFNAASAVGDWLQFTLANLSAATYNIKMYFKANNNRCICQGSVDGTNLGTTCDEYRSAAAYQVVFDMGNKSLTSGNHTIRFTVTGKNASSGGYTMTVDKIVLTPQALPNYLLNVTAANGTVSLSPSGGTYVSGTIVTLSATPAAGYTFSGWTGDLSGTANPATITMNANKNVTANFLAVPKYTLTTTAANGSIGLSPSGGTYNSGTAVTVTASPAAGFRFIGWSGDLSGTANPTTITMNANKSVTANFEAIPQFTITTTAANGTISLNPAGGTYYEGTVVTVGATPDLGYKFTGWSEDLSGTTNPATITMTGNKSVTANFIQIPTYTLTTSAANGSVSLNPAGGTYNEGTVVTLTATPDLGYKFAGWSGDLSGATNPATIAMTGNRGVTANFIQIPTYTLTTSAVNGSVSLNPAGGTYNEGTVVTLTATPDAGYRFTGWSGDLTGSSNPATITVNGNKNVTADFIAVYTLTTSATNGSVSLNPAGGTYSAGSVVTLTATPAAGYAFNGWSGDLTGTANPATITMSGNKNVTANFIVSQVVTTYEGESLTRSTSTFNSTSVVSDTKASGGKYVQLAGTFGVRTGNWVEFTTPSLVAGTYRISMYFKSGNNLGIHQASIDGVNQGSPRDEYAATAAYLVESNLGSKALAAGTHKIRFTVTGKNAASSGYPLTVDKIVLTR